MALGDKKPVVMEEDKAVPGGVATLGSDGKLSDSQIPDLEALGVVEYIKSLPFTRKNLLDNWYFADPVNQRDGWVAPVNTPWWIGPELSGDSGGVALAPRRIVEKTDAYARWVFNGTNYYCKADAVVPGYTGNGYTIDRWKLGSSGLVLIEDGYISFDPLDGVARNLEQKLEIAAPPGTYTMSALLENAEGVKVICKVNDGYKSSDACPSDEKQVLSRTFTVSEETVFTFVIQTTKQIGIYAAKLEPGSQQTLAHQDADGNWVLNDPPPNKALELAKCQRYYEQSAWTAHYGSPTDKNYIDFPSSHFYKQVKRAMPKISVNPNPSHPLHVWRVSDNAPVSDAELVIPTAYNTHACSPRIYSPGGAFVTGEMYGFYIGDNAYFIDAEL